MLIIGLGEIGSRLAKLAKTFGMRVLGVKQDITRHDGTADEVYSPQQLPRLFSQADFVVLCCPLTSSTRNVIDAGAFSAMKVAGHLVNVARGGCVDEAALATALTTGQIAAMNRYRWIRLSGQWTISSSRPTRRVRPENTKTM